jgi:hypothetical protein
VAIPVHSSHHDKKKAAPGRRGGQSGEERSGRDVGSVKGGEGAAATGESRSYFTEATKAGC